MMIECCNCTYREKICTIFTFVPLKIPPMHRLLQSFKRSRKEKNVLQTLFCDNLIDSWPTKRLPSFFALTPLYPWSRSLNYICDCSASIHRCFNIGPLRNNTLHYRCSVQFFIHIHHTKELLSNQDQWSSALTHNSAHICRLHPRVAHYPARGCNEAKGAQQTTTKINVWMFIHPLCTTNQTNTMFAPEAEGEIWSSPEIRLEDNTIIPSCFPFSSSKYLVSSNLIALLIELCQVIMRLSPGHHHHPYSRSIFSAAWFGTLRCTALCGHKIPNSIKFFTVYMDSDRVGKRRPNFTDREKQFIFTFYIPWSVQGFVIAATA